MPLDIACEAENYDFLKTWLEKLEKYTPDENDSEEAKKQKRKEYDLWRYEYPINELL